MTTCCGFSHSHQLMLIGLSFLDRMNNVMQSTRLDGKPISLLFSLSPFWTAGVSSLYLNTILSDYTLDIRHDKPSQARRCLDAKRSKAAPSPKLTDPKSTKPQRRRPSSYPGSSIASESVIFQSPRSQSKSSSPKHHVSTQISIRRKPIEKQDQL